MPIPNRNGYYTGQMFTNELGERYVWIGSEWKTAGNDNYTPVSAAREVNITFNTFLEEGGNSVQAKVLVNDVEWADSSSQNGKITLKFFDYQILNPTKISFIGTNVKSKKSFIIQAKVNQENEVTIKEADEFGNLINDTPRPPDVGFRKRELIEPDTENARIRRRVLGINPNGLRSDVIEQPTLIRTIAGNVYSDTPTMDTTEVRRPGLLGIGNRRIAD